MNDPFEKLIRPKGSFDQETKERLANILEPYVWLEKESSSISFKETINDLNALQKILIFVLARKAISLITNGDTGAFSPSEVESGTQIPGGTVRPKLGELTKRKILIRTESGYEVSPYFLRESEKIMKG